MGYRLLIALCTLALMSSCAAFDTDPDHIEGFGDKDTPDHAESVETGPLSGYYEGKTVLSSDNTCESVQDDSGVESKFSIEVIQSNDTVSIIFSDRASKSGKLSKNKTTVMKQNKNSKEVYYFTFEDEEDSKKVTGSYEVIEPDEEDQYSEPCATYSFELEKGEKPSEDGEKEDDEEEEEEKK